jgi:WxL domain surface cell wall-binding
MRKLFTLSLTALFALAFTAQATLASDGTQVVVTAGSLAITNPAAGDFTPVTLSGQATTTSASLATFSVTDATGSGDGWHVTAQADQFTGSTHNLALSSLTMSEPTVASPGTSSPDPTIEPGPYTIDAATAVQIASAALNEGMGQYDFGATTLTLSLPADTYADTYNSTVTISVVTAP